MFGFGKKKDLSEMTNLIDSFMTFSFLFMTDPQELLFNELELDFENDEKLIKEMVLAFHCFTFLLMQGYIAAVKDETTRNELIRYLDEKTLALKGLDRLFLLKNTAKEIKISDSLRPLAERIIGHLFINYSKIMNQSLSAEKVRESYIYLNVFLIQDLLGFKPNQKQNDLIYKTSALIYDQTCAPSCAAFMNINLLSS